MNHTKALSLSAAVSVLSLIVAAPAFAQELDIGEIVITPNRTPIDKAKTGSKVETVSKDEIEAQARPLIVDYLNQLPGIHITSPGGQGTEASLSVRGLPRRYVKTLYNGIDISDPTSTQVQTSYQYLLADSVGSIEVLKGSQSTLYGSDAIAGVISVSTLGGIEPGVKHLVGVEAGSNGTVRGAYGLRAANDKASLSFNAAGYHTDGISSAALGTENDAFDLGNLDINGEYRFNENFSVFASALYIKGRSNYDNDRYVIPRTGEIVEPSDNLQNRNATEQAAARFGFNLDLLDGRLKNTASVQVFQLDRAIRSVDPINGAFDADYTGKRTKFDYQGSFEASTWLTLQYGADHERQGAEATDNYGTDTDETFSLTGVWTQAILEPVENLVLTGGLRHDSHSAFGGHLTYRGTASYLFDQTGTRLHGSVGTGFRAPSLYELYGPYVGNTALKPETSFSFDAGVEQTLLDGALVADVTFFMLDVENLILYDNVTFNYQQAPGTTKSRGVETSVTWKASSWFDVGANYTYTDARDPDGDRAIRIPEHAIGLQATVRPAEKWTISATAKIPLDTLDTIIVGSQAYTTSFGCDPDPSPCTRYSAVRGDVKLDDYVLINAKVAYKPTENTEAYVRVENLLDQDYQVSPGFGTAGISAFAGFKAQF
ncbi:TonB-dependent receptor plug domain-containing protein [Aquibium microcysteis]|uniref:TonB-dependent receptor plug domain-containing protein n=1 Tax=Aquibium microcysteis TaxID=675281 RepID=UPI00165D0DE1|nr:TonB-dependent receptor [Aquibium microcysteis]